MFPCVATLSRLTVFSSQEYSSGIHFRDLNDLPDGFLATGIGPPGFVVVLVVVVFPFTTFGLVAATSGFIAGTADPGVLVIVDATVRRAVGPGVDTPEPIGLLEEASLFLRVGIDFEKGTVLTGDEVGNGGLKV